MTLYISAENPHLREMIAKQIANHRWTDSGFDIPLNAYSVDVDLNYTTMSFSVGIRVAAMLDEDTPAPCLLLPRSSIYKTPFRLCNSIGLIDAGYRGEVIAKVDIIHHPNQTSIQLDSGTRLFQLCQHNFLPWKKIIIVDKLPAAPDNRGEGGFGSTGLQLENHPRT